MPAAGRVEVNLVVGREGEDAVDSPCALFELVGGADSVRVQRNGSVLGLFQTTGGASGGAASGGAPDAGELHNFVVRWPDAGEIVLEVDGAVAQTIALPAWSNTFSALHFGRRADGTERCDVAVQLPGALVD